MRHHLASFLISAALMACSARSTAQYSAPEGDHLMIDLCTCMSAIDLRKSDASVEHGVRDCLEEAVLSHPAEVRLVLQHARPERSRAFQLGSLLGGALERDCVHFKAVRARLQQMPPASKRQGT